MAGGSSLDPSPHIRGAFLGLDLGHTQADVVRAVLEGIALNLRVVLDELRRLCYIGDEMVAVGGGSKSKLWRQILADIFNTEITTLNVTEGAAYGAALLAGVGVEVYPDVGAASEQVVSETGRTSPGPATDVYGRYYPHYRALYPALAGEFAAITDVVNEG